MTLEPNQTDMYQTQLFSFARRETLQQTELRVPLPQPASRSFDKLETLTQQVEREQTTVVADVAVCTTDLPIRSLRSHPDPNP